ncbi:hypothetical protein GLYMA_06G073150v4 [Glycine max]|nr:hypothetical protein GLYMA_06G073150v4 [Glycine max]KAH1124613.1 hypothetical protein GYH30_014350 [Glycine max]
MWFTAGIFLWICGGRSSADETPSLYRYILSIALTAISCCLCS